MQRCLLTTLLLLTWTAASTAQTASDAVKALAGGWEVSNADRDRVCMLTLKTEPARSGFRLELDPACAGTIPPIAQVEAWTLSNDTVRLLDTRGQVIFNFAEVESGMYEAERAGELYFMQNLAAAGPAFHTPDEMAGNWSINRGNRAICAVTLSRDAAAGGPEGAMALRVAPGCDAAVTRFNPVNWRMDQGELVLSSADETSWRFAQEEKQSSAAWKRVPFRADSMTMVKK